MVALQVTFTKACGTILLCGQRMSTRDSTQSVTPTTRQGTRATTIGTLLPFLGTLATHFKSYNCAHYADGTTGDSGGDFIDGRANDDTLEIVQKCVPCTNGVWVDGHAGGS